MEFGSVFMREAKGKGEKNGDGKVLCGEPVRDEHWGGGEITGPDVS